MDERGANIDLLFRNGLIDYEVLPPPEVWDNIQPAIKVLPKSFRLQRIAAVAAILVSLSFTAYLLTRDIQPQFDFPVLTLNVESMTPVFAPPIKTTVKSVPEIAIAQVVIPETNSVEIPATEVSFEKDITTSPEPTGLSDMRMATLKYSLQHGTVQSSVATATKKTFEIVLSDPEFIPETSTYNNSKRWSIGAIAAPTYYSTFNSEKSDISQELSSSEQALLSYTGGVALAYKMNKRFSIQSGLYYSSLGQEINGISSYGGFQRFVYTKGDHNFEVATSSGPIFTSNPDVFLASTGPGERIKTVYTSNVFDPEKVQLNYINGSLIQNFSYLELPIVLRYKVIDKALDFNLIGGVSYNMLVKNSVYTTNGNVRYEIGETRGLNTLTLSSSIGMGMEYSFSGNLSLNLEPTFRYYLNPFDPSALSDNHPYTFGIFTGISYKF
jgi:hypothetical protein